MVIQDRQGFQDGQDMQGNTLSEIDWQLPLLEFVKRFVDNPSEPSGPEWKSATWDFTRLMRGFFPEGTNANEAFYLVNQAIETCGGWEDALGVDYDQAQAEFVTSWPKVRYRPDEDPVAQALVKAERYPVKAPARADRRYPTPKYDRFISLVGWLQQTMGDQSVYLPCKRIAEVLKTTPRMISMWRKMAIDDGFVQVTATHAFRSGGRSKATEFEVLPGFRTWFDEQIKKRIG